MTERRIRIFIAQADGEPIGTSSDGRPVFGYEDGVQTAADITGSFVPGSIRFTEGTK